MTISLVLAGIIGVLLLAYLAYAIARPDRF
jgi:K+-transporting ATPase KdpF subunit